MLEFSPRRAHALLAHCLLALGLPFAQEFFGLVSGERAIHQGLVCFFLQELRQRKGQCVVSSAFRVDLGDRLFYLFLATVREGADEVGGLIFDLLLSGFHALARHADKALCTACVYRLDNA